MKSFLTSRRVLWSLGEFIVVQLVTVATTVVLARLLSPAEYGLVAMLSLITGVASIMVESGLGQAIVQNQEVDEDDKSTAFWINVFLGAVFAFLVVIFGNAISDFYETPQVKEIVPIYACVILLASFGVVPRALLIRSFRVKAWGAVRVISSVLSGGIAVVCALQGFGVYSLAFQGLVAAGLTSVLSIFASNWLPHGSFSINSAFKLYRFSKFLLFSGFLEVVYSRFSTLLLGREYGSEILGYFSRAENIMGLATNATTYPITQLALPSFSTSAKNPSEMKLKLTSSLKVSCLANSFFMLTISALSEPIVLLLLGDQWLESAPIMSILCLSSLLLPAHNLNLVALTAIGRTDFYFYVEILKKLMGIPLLLVSFQWGVSGLAWGAVVYSFAAHFLNAWPVGRALGLGPFKQLLTLLPSFAVGTLAAGGAFVFVNYDQGMSNFLGLVISFLVSLLIFAGALMIACILLGVRKFIQLFFGEMIYLPFLTEKNR